MGSLNDLFIASGRELQVLEEILTRAGSCVNPADKLSDLSIDLMMLSTLEAILTDGNWEAIFDLNYINPVLDEGPEGPWLYPLSERLMKALVSLSPDRVVSAASSWAETDEWEVHDNNGVDTIAGVIDQLAGLAKKAAAEHKFMFLWTSL